MSVRGNVLVIEDENEVFEELEESLVAHNLFHAPSLTGVRDILRRKHMHLAIVDLNLKREENIRFSGLDYIATLRKRYPNMSILVISKYDDPGRIKTAFQNGADDYIWKGAYNPYDPDFRQIINRLVSASKQHALLSEQYRKDIHGKSPQTKQIRQTLRKYAETKQSFFLIAEVGIPLGLFVNYLHFHAANIHHHYAIDRQPVIMNAREMDTDQIREAFLHSQNRRDKSIMDLANNHILLIENTDRLSRTRQRELLEILQHFRYPGLTKTLSIQLVAGLRRDPKEALEKGRLHPDFYQALPKVAIPPLRDRKADLRALIPAWLAEQGVSPTWLPVEHLNYWLRYPYPGNEHELYDLLKQTLEHHQSKFQQSEKWKSTPVSLESYPAEILNGHDAEGDMFTQVARLELGYIERALQRFAGFRNQKSLAAELVGISSADNMTKTYIKKYWRLYPEIVSQYPMIMTCYGLSHSHSGKIG